MKKLLMTIVLMPMMAMALELSPSYSTEAVSKYKEKADSGDAEAQFLYARALVNGDGTKKNATNAFDYAKRSADQGYELSYRMVGMGHEFGWGGSSNVAEAAVWYGKFHAWAKPAAEKGDAWAQYQLGLCLEYGNGVAKDAKEAVKWYRKAAERESAPAQLRLGSCYENGIGIEKNFSEAMKWYRKAAEQGDVGAQCELALCCSDWNRNGMGRERSREEGLKWYRRAADQGDVWAQTILGNCYKWGQGVEKSLNEAVKWYRKAADQGYHEAQCILGLYYMYGVGVEVNQAESVKWYRKAAEQDYFLGQSALGLCYANGWGVATNQVEAVKWYLKAAAHAWGAAQYQLVVCYANGDGVERDIKEAVKWYCKFAKNPHRPSDDPEKADAAYSGGLKCPMRTKAERLAKLQKTYDALAALGEEIKGLPSDVRAKYEKDLRDAKFRLDRARKRGLNGKSVATNKVGSGIGAFAQKLLECDFLVNEQFKQNAKMYLCFLPVSRSLSWSMFDGAGKGGGMSRIAKIYAEVLKNDPDIEIIYFANDRSDEDALEWAKKRDVGFPVVAPDGGNPLRPCEPYSPRLSIVNADGAVLEDISIRGINPILEERLRELKVGAASELAQILQPPRQRLGGLRRPGQPTNNVLQKVTGPSADGVSRVSDKPAQGKIVVADKLQGCDFLLNKDFKKDVKFYLCLFSASWCPPCRAEMPRIAKTYAETLKDDPDIELIHFSRDQNDDKALAWAKEHDVKFPVVKPNGGNPLELHSRSIPHLFIVKADGTLLEEGHPMKLFTEEKLRKLK